MRIGDWSSDVCSSDLGGARRSPVDGPPDRAGDARKASRSCAGARIGGAARDDPGRRRADHRCARTARLEKTGARRSAPDALRAPILSPTASPAYRHPLFETTTAGPGQSYVQPGTPKTFGTARPALF